MNPYGRIMLNIDANRRGSTPLSTFPPSSGGIGIMLNSASRTLSWIARLKSDASGAETFGSPSVTGDTGTR